MTKARPLLLVALLALLGFAGYQGRVTSHQRAELTALRERTRTLDTEAAALRAKQSATLRDLAQAESELARLPAPRVDAGLPPAARAELENWLGRVKRLQQIFAEKPEQRIPEMRFLTEDDWLRTSKTAKMDTDDGVRDALGAIRGRALAHFAKQLVAANQKYNRVAPGQKPATVQVLAPYFDPPVDLEILERYELHDPVPSGLGSPNTWFVQNKTPIDMDYDAQIRVGTQANYTARGGPSVWVPDYNERYKRAAQAYAQANQGTRPKGVADALPFFDPPLDAATADRLKRYAAKK
jgi:hypothetical protein